MINLEKKEGVCMVPKQQHKLRIVEGMSWDERKMAIQASLAWGFQSEAAEFPIASLTEGEPCPTKLEELKALLTQEENNPPVAYQAASDAARPVADFDWRAKKGLESLFSKGEFLLDNNLDLLPDKLNFYFVVPEEGSESLMVAACNFAFRFGMETTALDCWLAAPSYIGGNAVIFREGEICRIYQEESDDGTLVYVEGKGEELEVFSSWFCEHFPYSWERETWTSHLQEMTESFAMKNLQGQLAYLSTVNETGIQAYVSPEIAAQQEEVQQLFPDVEFINYKEMRKVYDKEYDIPWEVDTFRELLLEKVYPQVKAGDQVEILAALSEEQPLREELASELEQKLQEKQAKLKECQIYCAYKQGFSWLSESVIPKLKQETALERVEIGFRPFLPEGVTDWLDENGATPSYNNVGGDENKWYDLPIRYLQELYPIEDVLVKELGLTKEQISFVTYEGDQDITYECKSYGKEGTCLSNSVYKAAYSERPYLDAYKEMGKVHPSTGYLRVKVNGVAIVDEQIKTDVENIWDIYQRNVLKDCREFIERKTGGEVSAEKQPLFSQLRLEVVASEPDYRLDSREDMISTLDGLHEDMYFAGADYFKNYGNEKCQQMLEEPGLILPVIRKGSGKPTFKVILYDQAAEAPGIYAEGRQLIKTPTPAEIKLYLKEIRRQGEMFQVIIQSEGVSHEVAQGYIEVLTQREIAFGEALTLQLLAGEESYSVDLPARERIRKDLEITWIDIKEEELIGYEAYLEIINQLKRVPGLLVYQTATSYMGRQVYAIELLPKAKGYVSQTKRITNHPSEIINCRHHANEVSSTNAAFILLRTLLSEPQYKDVAESLNLVIVPMENVDGSAIHYELQKDNPYWKLHVARFNAVGKEFYHEHFKVDTKHTEAMSLTRLYERFLPDVIVDNHGVPSHEWEQQFSGYTSPSYKGFWLPRSLLYGYFWTVKNAEYASNEVVNKKIEDVVAEAIASDEEMRQWNKEWAHQFEIFAHQWMPKLFPANYYKEMINYWIYFEADPHHRYPSIRFPWITTVAYTSEVADETAQGEYLNLCARAHVKHDLAIINLLINAQCIYENTAVITAEQLKVSHTRLRPIVV
ncbi:hypothetical protein M2146_000110 [Lachnospiraceae bacterium PF1-22]